MSLRVHLCLLLAFPIFCFGQDIEVVHLTLSRAVKLALGEEGNLKTRLADEFTQQAQSRSRIVRADLLPDFEVSTTAGNMTRNLAILGLSESTLGFAFPARRRPVQRVRCSSFSEPEPLQHGFGLLISSLEDGGANSESNLNSTKEQVAAEVARSYISALRAQARVEAASADFLLPRAFKKQ